MCECFLFRSTRGTVLMMSRLSYVWPFSMAHMYILPNDLSFGSFKVICGQMRFLPLTFNGIEIEQWVWSRCVSIAETHRLICSMTYLTHQVDLGDLDLRSNFDIDFLRPTWVYFAASRREEDDGVRIISNYFKLLVIS